MISNKTIKSIALRSSKAIAVAGKSLLEKKEKQSYWFKVLRGEHVHNFKCTCNEIPEIAAYMLMFVRNPRLFMDVVLDFEGMKRIAL